MLLPPRLWNTLADHSAGWPRSTRLRSGRCTVHSTGVYLVLACSLASIWSLFTSRAASNARNCTAWLGLGFVVMNLINLNNMHIYCNCMAWDDCCMTTLCRKMEDTPWGSNRENISKNSFCKIVGINALRTNTGTQTFLIGREWSGVAEPRVPVARVPVASYWMIIITKLRVH